MAAVGMDRLVAKHVVGEVVGADAHVLLTEVLHLRLDGNGGLLLSQYCIVALVSTSKKNAPVAQPRGPS
jgi:hypothetical protein